MKSPSKKAQLAPLVMFVILIVFLWQGLHRDPHIIPSPLINKSFPDLQMPLLNNSQQKMTSESFKGHVSILNIFATWCLSCHAEHPILMDIANSGVVTVYGLDYKDNHGAVKSWLNKYGNPYQAIIDDPRGDLAINLGVYGTPETFIIDANGIIRDKYVGPITAKVWQNILLPKIKQLQKT